MILLGAVPRLSGAVPTDTLLPPVTATCALPWPPPASPAASWKTKHHFGIRNISNQVWDLGLMPGMCRSQVIWGDSVALIALLLWVLSLQVLGEGSHCPPHPSSSFPKADTRNCSFLCTAHPVQFSLLKCSKAPRFAPSKDSKLSSLSQRLIIASNTCSNFLQLPGFCSGTSRGLKLLLLFT